MAEQLTLSLFHRAEEVMVGSRLGFLDCAVEWMVVLSLTRIMAEEQRRGGLGYLPPLCTGISPWS